MVCESQARAISLNELWDGFGHKGFEREVFGLLRTVLGYIDESYTGESIPDVFCLTCTMAAGCEWPWIVMAWEKCLEEKNALLISQGRKPVSRYHSKDLNNFRNEFADWTGLEREEFCKSLMRVFARHTWGYEGCLLNLHELVEEWPETKDSPIPFAYDLLLKFLMIQIGKGITAEAHDYTVTLFHERCNCDGVLADSFGYMMNDPTFGYKDVFTTIAPMGWERCVPLQPADLVAYENFKEGRRLLPKPEEDAHRQRRIIFSELVSLESFVPHLKQISRENIRELRRIHEQRKNEKIEVAGCE